MGALLLQFVMISLVAGLAVRGDFVRPGRIRLAAPAEAKSAPALPSFFAPRPAPNRPAPQEPAGPKKIVPESVGVALTAATAALVDTRSGEVLFAQGEDRVVPIASVTKLMTALVILDADPDWDARVTFEASDDALSGIPYVRPGDVLSVRDAFEVMLVGSANNAAMALSRAVMPDRAAFVEAMNRKARALGLWHSRFVDPTGYGPENVSTAFDVARMADAAFGRTEIREALTRKEVVVRTAAGVERRVPATNTLLDSFLNGGDYQIVGGKTGYTEEAGYTLVMRVRRGEADVIGVVLGSRTSEDRFQDLKSLLAWGFRTYEW